MVNHVIDLIMNIDDYPYWTLKRLKDDIKRVQHPQIFLLFNHDIKQRKNIEKSQKSIRKSLKFSQEFNIFELKKSSFIHVFIESFQANKTWKFIEFSIPDKR